MTTPASSTIVQRLWNYCSVLRVSMSYKVKYISMGKIFLVPLRLPNLFQPDGKKLLAGISGAI
ncbi:MAG TPA: hypothetical protein VJ436_03785 [Anaerolineales bacterium]|nr:hypothetical protein [Anaerolineales bacterium]